MPAKLESVTRSTFLNHASVKQAVSQQLKFDARRIVTIFCKTILLPVIFSSEHTSSKNLLLGLIVKLVISREKAVE